MKSIRTAGALTAVACPRRPRSARRHGSVFETQARPATGPETQTQYLVTNHGFTYALKESNSATDRG